MTSRDQLGRLKQGIVILCPGQSYVLDLYHGFNQKQIANTDVESGDPSIAATQVFTSAQNHPSVRITAGVNESNEDKVTQVTVAVDIAGINASIPKPEPGRRVNLRDILSSYSDARTLTVRVLPKKQCDQLPPPAEKTRGRVGQDPPRVGVSPRAFRLCVGANKVLDMEQEIATKSRYTSRRTNPYGREYARNEIPPLTGMRLIANTNPAVLGVQLFSRQGGPVNVQLSGLAEGVSTVTLSEQPPAWNVVDSLRDTFNVEVKTCSEEERGRQQSWNGLGQGFELLPFSDLPMPDRTFDEESFPEAPPESTGEQSSTGSNQGGIKMAILSRTGNGLATLTNSATGIRVSLPADIQEGDIISYSVFKDNSPVSKDYKIEITSTATFSEEKSEEKPQARTQSRLAQVPGLFTSAIPRPVDKPVPSVRREPNGAIEQLKPKDPTVIVTVKDPRGNIVSRGTVPVKPEGHYPASSNFEFPKETVDETPARITGPFDQPIEMTDVTVDKKPANIMAKTPRGIIVTPPLGLTSGPHEWLVKEGARSAKANIRHSTLLKSSDKPGNRPTQESKALLTTPSDIDNKCSEEINAYRDEMRGRIDTGWKAPKPPRKGEFTTKLKYELLRTGSASNIQIVQSSGLPNQDQSAVNRVNEMKGYFKPIPACYQGSSLLIDHNFVVIYQ